MRIRKATATVLALVIAAAILPMIARAQAEFKDFLVVFSDQPDASSVSGITDMEHRRTALYQIALDTASLTQGGVLAVLRQQQSLANVGRVRCYYIVNVCAFSGTSSVSALLRTRAEVSDVVDDVQVKAKFSFPDPNQNIPLWHMDKTRAREAWRPNGSYPGFSGQGIEIASIDTGVLAQHADLSSKYRGNAFGTKHDHNWFDAQGWALSPNDGNGHGTHIMGTAVGGIGTGGDSALRDIGVAYGSKWISSKAFDSQGVGSTSDVLGAMQWVQFPTDASGRVDATAAPDIVLNAWEAPAMCTLPSGLKGWYQTAIAMWRAAGMLPVFQVGHEGAVASPANLGNVIAVGATDPTDNRAGFSSEGNSCGTPLATAKPDLYAPGVAIYSANNNVAGYMSKNGTGSSAAQVAGAAALMLEAAGGRGSLSLAELAQNLKATQSVCANTSSPECRRRLDVLEAAKAVQGTGAVRGTIRDSSGQPIPDATIKLRQLNHFDRKTVGAQLGTYEFPRVRAGDFVVEASAYGYETVKTSITLAASEVKNGIDFTLPDARRVTLSGQVTIASTGEPAAGAKVNVVGTNVEVITGLNGIYTIPDLPDPSNPDSVSPDEFDFAISVTGNPCTVTKVQKLSIPNNSSAMTLDFSLSSKRDAFGYSCQEMPLSWMPGDTFLPAKADDSATEVRLPFLFPIYDSAVKGSGATRDNTAFEYVYVSPNGYLRFDGTGTEFGNSTLPNPAAPNAAVYPYWDDLYMDAISSIHTTTTQHSFTVEWRDMTFHTPSTARMTFSATLFSNGDVEVKYLSLTGDGATGSSATVGIESRDGRAGFVYSFNEPNLKPGTAIYFSRAAQPVDLRGLVSDAASSAPLSGAQVSAVNPLESRATQSADDGIYRLRLQAGTYDMTASAWHYEPVGPVSVMLDCGIKLNCSPATRDFALNRLPGFDVTVHAKEGTEEIQYVPVTLGEPNVPDGVTGPSGHIFTDIPPGTYSPASTGSTRCRFEPTAHPPVNVTGNTVISLEMESRRDAFGYRCDDFAPASWIDVVPDPFDPEGQYRLDLSGDQGARTIDLPFLFPIYDEWRNSLSVSIDGHITFDEPSYQVLNDPIPSVQLPNLALFPFWDDLMVVQGSEIVVLEENTYVVVSWKNLALFKEPNTRVSFQAIIYDNGNFDFQYKGPIVGAGNGSSATIGLENITGTIGLQYSFNEPVTSDALKIQFIHPKNSGGGGIITGVEGFVRDADAQDNPNTEIDETVLPNVDIILGNGLVTGTVSSDDKGHYRVHVPPGPNYTLIASKSGYRPFVHPTLLTVPSTGLLTIDIYMSKRALHTVHGRIYDQRGINYGIGNLQIKFRCIDRYSDAQCFDEEENVVLDIPVTTLITGDYAVTLGEGDYELIVPGSGRCQSPSVTLVSLSSSNENPEVNVQSTLPSDSFGYTCLETELPHSFGQVPLVFATNPMPLVLPFEMNLYGESFRVVHIYGDTGKVRLGSLESLVTGPDGPTIKVFDDRLTFSVTETAASLRVFTSIYPQQSQVVIEWRDVGIAETQTTTGFTLVLRSALISAITGDAVGYIEDGLNRSGEVQMEYRPLANARSRGSQAKIGISDCTGGVSLTYASNAGTPVVHHGLVLLFSHRFESLAPSTC